MISSNVGRNRNSSKNNIIQEINSNEENLLNLRKSSKNLKPIRQSSGSLNTLNSIHAKNPNLNKRKNILKFESEKQNKRETNSHNINMPTSLNDILSRDKLKKFRELKIKKLRNNTLRQGSHTIIEVEEYMDHIEMKNINAETSFLIFHPDHFLKIIWDILGMIFIIYQSIMVPFRICFNADGLGHFETLQDFYFMADILITMNSGFYINGLITMTRKEIIISYFKCWFWLDIIASFPYSMTISIEAYFNNESVNSHSIKATQLLRLLKFMRMLRIMRLLRIFKLKKIFRQLEEYIMSDLFNLFLEMTKLLFIILFIAHIGACFWFLIGMSEFESYGYSWIIDAQIIDSDIYTQYIFSLYYYITTMTTTGYGDIVPKTSNEKLYAMFNMLLASGVCAYIIGSIGTFITSRYDAETNFKEKMLNLSQFLIHRNINKSLRFKIRKYLEHVLENKKEHKIDEKEVLGLLNKNLREEINLQLNCHVLRGINFLYKNEEFCLILTYAMREETLNPNEIIFDKNQESDRIYFITKGKVYICDQLTKIVFKELSEDNFFGEIGFFSKMPRITSAETLNFVYLTYLSFDDFIEMAYKFQISNREKFNLLKNDIEQVFREIRRSNFDLIKSQCYLCDSFTHLSVMCPKLKSIDELFKIKYKDKKHKTEKELENIFKIFHGKDNITLCNSKEESADNLSLNVNSDNENEFFFDDSIFKVENENIDVVREYVL